MNKSQPTGDGDFAPTTSWQTLRLRAEMFARLRVFFQRRGFLEVETPLLSADVVIDQHIDPIPVQLDGRAMWLQTSPEAAMKRLLASGGEAIFQFARAFRCGERSALHNVEFTLLEWYRVSDSPEQAMRLLAELAQETLGQLYDEKSKPSGAELLSYGEAFRRVLDIDPHLAEVAELAACAEAHDVQAPQGLADDKDAWLDLLLSQRVQPRLGIDRPTILLDYPPSQAALAQVRHDDPPVAERFELYVHGVELANGYHELLDAEELRSRAELANQRRVAEGKQSLPIESRLIQAMRSGLSPCCGVALGFDRLMMLAVGADSIDQVIPFPIERA